MKVLAKILMVAILALTFTSSAAFAEIIAPTTLEDGNLILIASYEKDKVFYYANRKSVKVQKSEKPFYQVSMDGVQIKFSDEYYQKHGNYINAPYTISENLNFRFQYRIEGNFRDIFVDRKGNWNICWDVPSSYRHSAGSPMVTNAAEVAFVSAFNKKFIGDEIDRYTGKPVIDKSLYDALGI